MSVPVKTELKSKLTLLAEKELERLLAEHDQALLMAAGEYRNNTMTKLTYAIQSWMKVIT